MENRLAKMLKTSAMLFVAVLTLALGSCQDEVDESAMYSFKGQQVIDFLRTNDSTTYFAYLATKVKLSKKSESTVAELLSARGNYTVFAPTNRAVQNYVDSVYNTKNFPIEECPDSTAADIINNSMIDNENYEPYLSTSFAVGSFRRPSFADRFLTVRFDTLEAGRLGIYINTNSLVINADNEVENGVIHLVDRVITPSNETVAALISNTNNLRVFSHLLTLTGWDKIMTKFRDDRYEESHPVEGPGCSTEEGGAMQPCPQHRNYGYTVFCETDSVFQKVWGLPEFVYAANGDLANWSDVMSVILTKVQEAYPNATSGDYQSKDNALNQFISYHVLPMAITYDQLVIHYNEKEYGYRNPNQLGINAWEYYETMSSKGRKLMKITEGAQTEGKRINRYVSEYDMTNYHEVTVPRKGILIMESNGGRDYNALNGYYYAIDSVLVYDDDVPNKVLNERLRFDICSMLPEQITNGFRRPNENQRYHLPNRYELGGYDYFENMSYTDETNCNYLPGYGSGWLDYQGDEYNIEGQYDVIVKLPPVPTYGTYQLRYFTQNVADRRSMCQFYFGENKQNLMAIGLPLDMRIMATTPTIGYEPDTKDEDHNDENDRIMYIHNYMKGPKYFGANHATAVTTDVRSSERCMRRIITTQNMDPNKTYYLRMKSVLESTKKQLFIDFFELVPKNVYAGVYAEDKW